MGYTDGDATRQRTGQLRLMTIREGRLGHLLDPLPLLGPPLMVRRVSVDVQRH